ncbi:MAG: GFA family protein [Porticoccaceae bacterium]
MKTTGSCLCGCVHFEIEGEFEQFFLCHCSRCRKDTGSAHAANLFSHGANLQWLSGEELVQTFTLPATRHTRSFCTVCGSALPIEIPGESFIVIPAGSLDEEIAIKPTAHIFVGSKAGWDHNLELAPKYQALPQHI